MPFDKEPDTQEKGNDTQPDFDMAAAQADVSSELFGQGDKEEGQTIQPDGKPDGSKAAEGEGQSSTGTESGDVVAPLQLDADGKPIEAEGGDNAEAVQDIGAPKTWTKAALEKWATLDPVVKAEVAKREEDFMRGISGYKEAADVGTRYSKILEPYAAIMQAENIDADQTMQAFAANHYLLTRGTAEQKIQLAANMLSGYNIPLPELLEYMADNLPDGPVDPRVSALEEQVRQLTNTNTTARNAASAQTGERIAAEIEAFAADPAHPHFNDLANDIHQLFEKGMATTLPEAYEKAVYANPVTRQKEIDRLTAERTSVVQTAEQKRKDQIARSTADSVTLTPKSRDGTVPTGSIDDTLAETMAAIESRG